MKLPPHARPNIRQQGDVKMAFTLLEVMVAVAIFFAALFAILDLTSRNLRAARSLKPVKIDLTALAGELSLTNRLIEGTEYGDFGKVYPDHSWMREIVEVSSNGLFQVTFAIYGVNGKNVAETKSTILLYRPLSPPGSASGGFR